MCWCKSRRRPVPARGIVKHVWPTGRLCETRPGVCDYSALAGCYQNGSLGCGQPSYSAHHVARRGGARPPSQHPVAGIWTGDAPFGSPRDVRLFSWAGAWRAGDSAQILLAVPRRYSLTGGRVSITPCCRGVAAHADCLRQHAQRPTPTVQSQASRCAPYDTHPSRTSPAACLIAETAAACPLRPATSAVS